MTFFHKLSNNSQGIFFAIAGCFIASILISLVRHLSAEFHIFFIVMMRNFFGLLFFVPTILRDHNDILKTKRIKMHVMRGLNALISMLLWFYAISVLPLSEAVSISFIMPILTTIAAIFLFKEKVKSKSWVASFLGLIGIIIILRPGFKDLNIAHLCSLISVLLWVVSNIMIKSMTKTEKPKTIVAYTTFIIFICSIPLALPYLQALNFEDICWFAFLGLMSNLLYICISSSYAKVDLSVTQPYDFTRLIFTAVISYFAFGEIVDFWVIIGSLVILSGTIIVIPKPKMSQMRRKKKPKKEIFIDPI